MTVANLKRSVLTKAERAVVEEFKAWVAGGMVDDDLPPLNHVEPIKLRPSRDAKPNRPWAKHERNAEIARRIIEGARPVDLAREYGVAASRITRIAKREWSA